MQKGKITITGHARRRLSERIPNLHPSNYVAFVNNARYNGATVSELRENNPEVARYICENFKSDNSTQIRYHKNCVFIFSGNNHKSRTLVTVVNLEKAS